MVIHSCLRVDNHRATFEFCVAAFERTQRLVCPQKSVDFFFRLKFLSLSLALLFLLALVELVVLEGGVLVLVHRVVHHGIARRKKKRFRQLLVSGNAFDRSVWRQARLA